MLKFVKVICCELLKCTQMCFIHVASSPFVIMMQSHSVDSRRFFCVHIFQIFIGLLFKSAPMFKDNDKRWNQFHLHLMLFSFPIVILIIFEFPFRSHPIRWQFPSSSSNLIVSNRFTLWDRFLPHAKLTFYFLLFLLFIHKFSISIHFNISGSHNSQLKAIRIFFSCWRFVK